MQLACRPSQADSAHALDAADCPPRSNCLKPDATPGSRVCGGRRPPARVPSREPHLNRSYGPSASSRPSSRRSPTRRCRGSEGAPDAWLEVDAPFADALHGIEVGDELIVITWFHRADRGVRCRHARARTRATRLTGVFATRSPDRPNPLGLHPVTVRALDGNRRARRPESRRSTARRSSTSSRC